MPQSLEPPRSAVEPYFLADHPVIDLLNTIAVANGQPMDFLESDGDVLRWLERAGFGTFLRAPAFAPSALLNTARRLREAIRRLVVKRKAGMRADVGEINEFLAAARSYPQIEWEGHKLPRMVREREQKTPEQFLAPVSEAAAELLVNGDFNLIRKCEDSSCVLWFYDRTKSHRRRWCSMAACGNRNKVKAFRQRQER
jgi:predicted RNA-binding Zn ribbon-like protein